MKRVVYPVIFEKTSEGYFVTIPDLHRNTQGENIADAIVAARDLICLTIIDWEDDGIQIPIANSVPYSVPKNAFTSYVDADIEAYRKKYGTKTVRRNVSIPAWLNTKAESMKINFSQTLQEALIAKINQQ